MLFRRILDQLLPVAISGALLLFIVYQCLDRILSQNQMHFSYGLDDAYIHLNIAKNAAFHHTWGMWPGEPGGTSSSPLWGGVLALVLALGADERAPLILNAALALFSLSQLNRLLSDLPMLLRALAICGIMLCIPEPTLIFNGMEHMLQIVLALSVLRLLPKILDGQRVGTWYALAFLSVSLRYEAAFLVLLVAFLIIEQGNWRRAVIGLGLGGLPILGYGLWLKEQGWPFFPAGILVKTAVGQPSMAVQIAAGLIKIIENIYMAGPLLLLLLGAAVLSLCTEGAQRHRLIVASGVAFLHILLAGFGHAFRYEAYLYALLLVALIPPLVTQLKAGLASHLPMAACLLLGFLPLGHRAGKALMDVPTASMNIYMQQQQMATFLKRYYRDECVVANDIGAISFYGDVHILDIAGLGSKEVLALRDPHVDRAAALGQLAQGCDAHVAVVYADWLGTVPQGWVAVERWKVPHSVVLGGDTVTFFSTSPDAAETLSNRLEAFARLLPEGVSREHVLP